MRYRSAGVLLLVHGTGALIGIAVAVALTRVGASRPVLLVLVIVLGALAALGAVLGKQAEDALTSERKLTEQLARPAQRPLMELIDARTLEVQAAVLVGAAAGAGATFVAATAFLDAAKGLPDDVWRRVALGTIVALFAAVIGLARVYNVRRHLIAFDARIRDEIARQQSRDSLLAQLQAVPASAFDDWPQRGSGAA